MNDKRQIRLRRPLTLLVLYGGFLAFLFSTDPRKLAVGWLIAPFIWLYAALFLTFIYAIDWFALSRNHTKKQTVIAGLLAAVPVTMLLLDSVDQLTLKDALLIIGLAALALFYITKINLEPNK